MAIRVCSSQDYSRLGVVSCNPGREFNKLALRRLRVYKFRGSWTYLYTPSKDYTNKIAELSKRVDTAFLEESWANRARRKGREKKALLDRCEVLVAAIIITRARHGEYTTDKQTD